jgi:IS1 family transposase
MKNPDIVGVDSSGVTEFSIAIDTPGWFEWLKKQRSFSYRKGTNGGFTCSRRGNNKWYAVKKIHATNGGKTVPLYIGDDSECTQEKLEYLYQHFGMKSADFWNWYYSSERSRKPKKSCTSNKCATNSEALVSDSEEVVQLRAEIERLKAELEAANQELKEKLEVLHTQLGNTESEKVCQLEARIAQLERQLAKEAADAQKYYPGWRKLPGLESELRFSKSKRAELEADNQILRESLAAKESDAGCTQKALELLDKYLGEAGIPLDEKGKPKARYDQLAKFKSWLVHQ